MSAQLDEFWNEDGRQVIDAKIAQVFKIAAGLSFAAAAHARHDYYPRLVGEFFFIFHTEFLLFTVEHTFFEIFVHTFFVGVKESMQRKTL